MATAKASISYPHVTKTPGVCGGKACIDGTRIRVNNVVFLHKDGANDAKIRETYPDLTPARSTPRLPTTTTTARRSTPSWPRMRLGLSLSGKWRPVSPSTRTPSRLYPSRSPIS